jgi:protein-tyrosine phosphatase
LDWIIDNIAIGNYLEARDFSMLRQHGFRSALSLDGTLQPDDAAALGLAKVVSVPLEDGPGNDSRRFRHAVDSLGALLVAHPPVLVQCHAGRSRSAVVVAGFLMLEEDLSAAQAIARVGANRDICITSGLELLLQDWR